MKKIIFTLASLILTSCASTKLPPAPASDNMMEQADQIIIVTDEEPKETYKQFAQYLTSNGYSFESTNETLLTLQTENKMSQKKRGFRIYYRVNAAVIDSTIKLNGIVAYPMGNEDEAKNAGGNNDEPRVAWEHIVELANNYPEADRILYKRN